MIKSKDELIAEINGFIGEAATDEALAILEDVTDTLEELTKEPETDETDWKAEAGRIDAEWREKYRQRFLTGEPEREKTEEEEVKEVKTYDDLFVEE